MPSVFLLRRSRPSLQRAQGSVETMLNWEVAGSSTSVHEAAELVPMLAPDFIAADLHLLDGAVSKLAFHMQQWAQRPQLLLLMPTANDPQLFDALRAGGGHSCVDVDGGPGLCQALQQLADGRASMSPQIARQTLEAFGLPRTSLLDAQPVGGGQDLTPLTNQLARGLLRNEHHLLSLLAHGLLSTEIGAAWRIGQSNVERRLWELYTKLHALYRQPALA
jgi:DNA-binding NarL/FixJ family response regulator